MPGIVGIISKRPGNECMSVVRTMIDEMASEPFYTFGTKFVAGMGIYAGWIALKGSFADQQVFTNEDGAITLLLSGECFVDSSRLHALLAQGHILSTRKGDWLTHLYEEEGENFFKGLNGLFSGLLIDQRQQKAFLFNDRYGIERIYFHESSDEFFFASEAKALLRVRPELRSFDHIGLAQYLAIGCTLGTRSLFSGITLLPGGSVCTFQYGVRQQRQYFTPAEWESLPELPRDAFLEEFVATFNRIISRYTEFDGAIGIALTAGFDTRMIMASLPATAMAPVSFTFSGMERDTLDAILGARVAAACGLEHHILRVQNNFFDEFGSYSDRTVRATDGALGPTGAHEIYMNARARALSRMRLTGNYGSEVLRGVRRFKPLRLSADLFGPSLAHSVTEIAKELTSTQVHPVTFAAFEEIPRQRHGILIAGTSQLAFRTPYLDNELVRLAYQAPYALRSPATAIRLVSASRPHLLQIPTTNGLLGSSTGFMAAVKRCHARITFKSDYLYNEGLPDGFSLIDRLLRRCGPPLGLIGAHKHLHYRSWFRRELSGYVLEMLKDYGTRTSIPWNKRILGQIATDHIRGRKNYVEEINAALTFEAVERLFLRSTPTRTDANPTEEISSRSSAVEK